MRTELIEKLKQDFKDGLYLIEPHIIGHKTAKNLIVNSFNEAIQASEWVKVELEKLKTDLEKLKAKRTYEVDVDSMICILRDILTPPNR
jgi:hypothetical protein